MQRRELERELLTLGRDVKQTLPAVLRAFTLHHVTLVDQLLEDAAERLLGDAKNVEQLGDLHAGIAIDEVQDPVMRTAKAELDQHLVRIADEIAISKEQQLDEIPERLIELRSA